MADDDDMELQRLRQKRAEELMGLLKQREERNVWPGEVVHVGDHDLQETLEMYDAVLVDFWAPWCGPCKMVGPILDRLAPEVKGKAVIAKLNVDQNQQSASRFKVQGIPTMIMFKEGKPVERITGALPAESIMRIISRYAA